MKKIKHWIKEHKTTILACLGGLVCIGIGSYTGWKAGEKERNTLLEDNERYSNELGTLYSQLGARGIDDITVDEEKYTTLELLTVLSKNDVYFSENPDCLTFTHTKLVYVDDPE